jgi:hypothetical protein
MTVLRQPHALRYKEMRPFPTRTGEINQVSAVYHSKCHQGERTILEGQTFPRCARCNEDTVWIFINPLTRPRQGPKRR